MAKPAKVTEQPLEGVVHLGNDGKYHLGETGWLCHVVVIFLLCCLCSDHPADVPAVASLPAQFL